MDNQRKWLRIHDDILEVDDVIFTVCDSLRPDDLARVLLSLARLKVFIFSLPIEQARAVIWSLKFHTRVNELIADLDESWEELDFSKESRSQSCR